MIREVLALLLVTAGMTEVLSAKHKYYLPTCKETPFCNRNLHLQKEFTGQAA
jgi:hypothetical protein